MSIGRPFSQELPEYEFKNRDEQIFKKKKAIDEKIQKIVALQQKIAPLEKVELPDQMIQSELKLMQEEVKKIQALVVHEILDPQGLFSLLEAKEIAALKKVEGKDSFNAEEAREIIDCASEISHVLHVLEEQHVPEGQFKDLLVVRLFKEKMIPLTEKVLKKLSKVSKNAAARGKALQAGLKAMEKIQREKGGTVYGKTDSRQKVYLLGNAVYKKSNPRAHEEETLINQLFDLLAEEGVVSHFRMQKASPDRFGMPMHTQDMVKRGYTLFSFMLHGKLFDSLSPLLTAEGKKKIRSKPGEMKELCKQMDQIEKMRSHDLYYQKKGTNEWVKVSFEKMFEMYRKEEVGPEDLIKVREGKPFSLSTDSEDQVLLLNALKFNAQATSILFIPLFENKEMENGYIECERQHWFYEGKKITFKEVQTLFYENGEAIFKKISSDEKIIHSKPNQSLEDISKEYNIPIQELYQFNKDLSQTKDFSPWAPLEGNQAIHLNAAKSVKEMEALLKSIRWDVQMPTLMEGDNFLSDFDAKPFVENMFLMKEILESKKLERALFERLDSDSEYHAVLTEEFQSLDMHSENLGVAPVANDEYEELKDVQVFSISTKGQQQQLSFTELLKAHLLDELPEDAHISYRVGEDDVEGTLAALPTLKKALDVKWRLVFFDTDLMLSEDNDLQWQLRTTSAFTVQMGDKQITYNFPLFYEAYQRGKIPPESVISYVIDGKKFKGTIDQLEELKGALAVPIQEIMDPEGELAKNKVVIYHNETFCKKEFLIPFRSVLLEVEWKDHPLSEMTVAKLLENEKREEELLHWIRGEDRPIFRRMAQDKKEAIFKQLEPYLERYTLSNLREENHYTPVADLQKQFAKEFSEYKTERQREIWTQIEEALSYVVKEVDTLDGIAKQEHLDIRVLRKLNPDIGEDEILARGTKIKVEDIASNTPLALKRRLKYAVQLFPRLTVKQQSALFERRKARVEYLKSYQVLQALEVHEMDVNALEKALLAFLDHPHSPLSSRRKESLINSVEGALTTEALLELHERILKETKPTFFNVAKVMYPLLADMYELSKDVYGSKLAGASIGAYTYPLGELVQKGLKSPLNVVKKEAALLYKKLEKEKDHAAFFGNWS